MSPATSVAKLISYGQKISGFWRYILKDQIQRLIQFTSKSNEVYIIIFLLLDAFCFQFSVDNELVSKCSIEMAKKAIELVYAWASVYSFHAGFLVDPSLNN